MTAHPVRLQRAIDAEMFMSTICELLAATRAHEQAKTAAKRTIMDSYSEGQLDEWGVLDLIQKYGLEAA